jgi:hypothetical protein
MPGLLSRSLKTRCSLEVSGEIVFRQGRSSGGGVPIRLEGLSPETKARIVSRAINAHLEEIP